MSIYTLHRQVRRLDKTLCGNGGKYSTGDVLFSDRGKRIVLGRYIAEGGEGSVFAVHLPSETTLVTKLYHPTRRMRWREQKLRLICSRPIRSSSLHPAIALVKKFPSEASSPPAIRPDYLSPSSVKSYLSCSLRFFFERVAQIRKSTTVALHVGKAIHATLQSFNLARWQGEDSSETAMEEAFSTHFLELEKMEGPVDYADEETRQKVRSCAWNTVKAYMASDEVTSQMPLGVEVGLSATIPGLPVPVRGIIDLVQHDLTAVDYKSTAAKPDAEHAAFDHELQLVTYQMMIEEATGDTPPSLDLIYLVKTKTPQIIRVKTPPANEQRKQRIADLYKIACEGITSERFHPQPGMQCFWCQYRRECSGWCKEVRR